MTPDECWARLASIPVAVLGTISSDGSPHLVPFTFVPVGDRKLASAVDSKPKTSRDLRRLENIRRDARVTVLAHHYDADWTGLWWVRAEGTAEICSEEPMDSVRAGLLERYPDYATHELGPWLLIAVQRLTGWTGAGPTPPRR